MENRAHALAAGLFTLLLGAALAAVALWFSKDEHKLIPYALVTKRAVTGLKLEAPVRYRGVDVGKVESIGIADGGSVRIRIGVREGTPITTGTYAQLGYQGITGLAYVLLGDDGASGKLLASNARQVALLQLKPSLIDQGEALFDSVAEISDRLKRLLDDDNQRRVERTLDGLEQATQRANELSAKLEPGLAALPGLIAEARGLAGDARSSVERADRLIASVNGLALKLDARVDTLSRALSGVEQVGFTARALGDDTMPRMNGLIDDLAKDSHALGRVIDRLDEQPQSIVFGTPPGRPGPGEPGFLDGR